MNLMSTTSRKLAAGALAAATVLGGGGAALAATTHPAHHRVHHGTFRPVRHLYFAGADHMSAEVPRHGTWVTLDWDRGTVTGYSDTSLTVQRPDGQSVQFTITPDTVFRERSKANLDGDRARVISDSAGDALVVTLNRPGKAAPAGDSGPAGVTGPASS